MRRSSSAVLHTCPLPDGALGGGPTGLAALDRFFGGASSQAKASAPGGASAAAEAAAAAAAAVAGPDPFRCFFDPRLGGAAVGRAKDPP